MWNNYPNNETFGYLTADNQLIMTDVLALDGGQASGTYKYVNPDGTTSYYFTYPDTQGAPAGTYTGIIHSAGKYFIPITASIHTHTPCRQDGTNGVSHNVGADDKAFATSAPGLKHWVIGCGAIGQFNSTSTNFFNILVGDLSTNCSKIN
ncbi:hypothetical protein BWD42_12950 [Sphingobacterium sp. CZ-UAM]|nr:hypothetical protein BWD42_12950 [Sphingobacterium sp. CZ-UAM]